MTINEYQKEAMRSVNPESLNDPVKGLSNTALGLYCIHYKKKSDVNLR